MEGVSSRKPATGYELEGMCGSIEGDMAGQSSGPERPYLSLSKPPLGATSPFRLRLKQPHSPSHTLDGVAAIAKTEQDKKQQHQAPDFAHKNITVSAASGDHDSSNPKTDQQETIQLPPSDARKLKRVVSNRVSAQRSRLKKLQRVASLERQSIQLENQIAFLQPQVAAYTNQRQLLILEKMVLSQKLAALDKEKMVRQAEIERNQAEVYMLREIEKQQKQELQAQAMMAYLNWETFSKNQFVPEQMVYPNIPAQEGTSGMEVDEQTLNFNSAGSMNELDAIVNPPKLSNKEPNPEFSYGF